MAEAEDAMWWYRGLRANVLTLLMRYAEATFVLLDAGCGTGGMLHRIREGFPGATLFGCDRSEIAVRYAANLTDARISCACVESLPYADSSIDVIVNLDVLGAGSLDILAAMREFGRVLKPGGLLILNVAAYQWMLSYHDEAVGQSTRFSRSDIGALLTTAGLRPVYTTYWNTILFPLMMLRRKLFAEKNGSSDVQKFSVMVNWLFSRTMDAESTLIKRGITLPFGGSLLAAAMKE